MVRLLLIPLLLAAASPAQTASPGDERRFVIVVTGMLVSADGNTETRDLSAGAGASVEVVARDGSSASRRAEVQPFRRGSATYYTADFAVAFEAVYDITITFASGTVIRLNEFVLPDEWKTHFSFYNTTGTTSAAAILRVERDERTGLCCYVYALWPWSAYQQMGGRQVAKDQQP
jgi:hypothetical protein